MRELHIRPGAIRDDAGFWLLFICLFMWFIVSRCCFCFVREISLKRLQVARFITHVFKYPQ